MTNEEPEPSRPAGHGLPPAGWPPYPTQPGWISAWPPTPPPGSPPNRPWSTGGPPGAATATIAPPQPTSSPTPPTGRPTRARTRPDRRALVVIVVVALAVDVAMRTTINGLAGAALVVTLAIGLLVSGRLPNRAAKLLALAAVPFGACLALRTSPWLIGPDILAAFGLLLASVMVARGGSLSDLGVRQVVHRSVNVLIGFVLAPAFLFGAIAATVPASSAGRREHRVAVARGLGIAVPVLAVLGLLLASSDAVFASLFHLPIDGDSVLVNGLLLVLGLWFAAGLLGAASEPDPPAYPELAKPFGIIEAGIVLGGLIVLYGGFAATQLVTALGGAEHVLRTAGLTRAEYARAGFFQLLGVAGLTLGVLLVVRATTGAASSPRVARLFLVLSELAVVLTLVIVAVAIIRLGLYDEAYGMTMLRLSCLATAWWLGVVFVAIGAAFAGVGRGRAWLFAAAAASALVIGLGLNVANPEAMVVRHNAGRFLTGASSERMDTEFDATYAQTLSDDAVPALAAELPHLPPDQQALVLIRICRGSPRRGYVPREDRGALGWNRAAVDARRIRDEVCG